jgi:23S rRNA pseudouridine2605 synthase
MPPLSKKPQKAEQTSSEDMRIAKRIAHAGLCSRRDAEKLVESGRVSVNGKVLTSPAVNVGERDIVLVDGKPLGEPQKARLFRYHKPRGRVTTHRDPQDRPTVFEALPPELPRLISVGRLDFNTEGLLLLTTDGDLARHLELPSLGWRRRYRARAFGSVNQADLDRLREGVTVDGVRYGPVEARLERGDTANPWLSVTLIEGKNREVRHLLEHIGLKVSRLIRLSYGPFQLGDLSPGEVEEVKPRVLAEQLGPVIAARLGLAAQKPTKPKGGKPGRQ